jgi:hypothetical protein
MLYREIIAVCSEIHTKYVNTAVWPKGFRLLNWWYKNFSLGFGESVRLVSLPSILIHLNTALNLCNYYNRIIINVIQSFPGTC